MITKGRNIVEAASMDHKEEVRIILFNAANKFNKCSNAPVNISYKSRNDKQIKIIKRIKSYKAISIID